MHPHLKFIDALKEACFSKMTKSNQCYNMLLHAQLELKNERDMKKIHQECDAQSNNNEVNNLKNKCEEKDLETLNLKGQVQRLEDEKRGK